MSAFHGNFFVRSTDLLAMPAVPQDQSYTIEVQIDETLTTPSVLFQTAVLHTTCYGATLVHRLIDRFSFCFSPKANAGSELSQPLSLPQPTCQRCSHLQTRSQSPPTWRTSPWNVP